jgi:hypothetical protein
VHHLLAFYKADTAGASFEAITAVQDQIINQSPNGNFMLPDNFDLWAAYIRDAGVTQARLNSPDFRLISLPHLHPVHRQAGMTDLPSVDWRYPTRLTIPKLDELILEVSNDGAGGVACTAALWIAPPGQNVNIPAGDVYKIHLTATSSGVAAKWELVAMTLESVLPVGVYTIIGMDVISRGAANAVEYARLAWVGGANAGSGSPWRPGVLVPRLQSMRNWRDWQNGRWGTWGSFKTTAPPSLEVFSVPGTGVTLDIYLDLVQTSRQI